MIRTKSIALAISLLSFSLSAAAQAQEFNIIPLYGIRVISENLKFSNIVITTNDASVVSDNGMPQLQKFNIVVQKPTGFKDSAGWSDYGLELKLENEHGKIVAYTKDIFDGNTMSQNSSISDISAGLTIDNNTKPKTKLTVKGKVFDKRSKGYISYVYDVLVLPASKRLPNKVLMYTNQDSKGMRSNSVGLRFNFFEFEGIKGNNFIYKLKKNDNIHFVIKGLMGWKLKEGVINPLGDIIILDAEGNELERTEDVLVAQMESDRKELDVRYKPKVKLAPGAPYFIWLKVRDANSKSNALDLVVKVYIE